MIVVAGGFIRIMEKVFFIKFKVRGIAIFPFIFIRNRDLKNNLVLINHEKIHIRQQLEMLFIGFILWYYIAMFRKGYRNISFEREAYENESNMNYLAERKFWSFLKYQKKS